MPSTPGGLSVSATGPTHALVTWTASTDDVAVTGYDVFRDGQLVGSVDAGDLSFADAGLEAERTYEYEVEAFDAAGNRSPRAGPVSVTTPGASVDPVVVAVGDIACDPRRRLRRGAGHRHRVPADGRVRPRPLARSHGRARPGRSAVRLRRLLGVPQSYDPSWGRLRVDHAPRAGQPRVRHDDHASHGDRMLGGLRCVRVLHVLRGCGRRSHEGLVQLRPRAGTSSP